MVNSIGGIFSITMTKTYWFVECPNCPARFSTIVWEKQKVSDATCPSCGFSASSSKKFKYLCQSPLPKGRGLNREVQE